MEDIVLAINQLSQTSMIDIFAIAAPLILSVVAVVISISTARKQNKIALFEKRYEMYRLLKAFYDEVSDNLDIVISGGSKVGLYKTVFDINKIRFLFNKGLYKEIKHLVGTVIVLNGACRDLSAEDDSSDERYENIEALLKIYNSIEFEMLLRKMEKYLYLR